MVCISAFEDTPYGRTLSYLLGHASTPEPIFPTFRIETSSQSCLGMRVGPDQDSHSFLFWKKGGLTERNSVCVLVCVCVSLAGSVLAARRWPGPGAPAGADSRRCGETSRGRRGCVGNRSLPPGRPSKVDPSSQGRFSVMETLSFSSIPSVFDP